MPSEKQVKSLQSAQSEEIVIDVRGMTCEHCVRRVTKALEKLPGVSEVKVSLPEEVL